MGLPGTRSAEAWWICGCPGGQCLLAGHGGMPLEDFLRTPAAGWMN